MLPQISEVPQCILGFTLRSCFNAKPKSLNCPGVLSSVCARCSISESSLCPPLFTEDNTKQRVLFFALLFHFSAFFSYFLLFLSFNLTEPCSRIAPYCRINVKVNTTLAAPDCLQCSRMSIVTDKSCLLLTLYIPDSSNSIRHQ